MVKGTKILGKDLPMGVRDQSRMVKILQNLRQRISQCHVAVNCLDLVEDLVIYTDLGKPFIPARIDLPNPFFEIARANLLKILYPGP